MRKLVHEHSNFLLSLFFNTRWLHLYILLHFDLLSDLFKPSSSHPILPSFHDWVQTEGTAASHFDVISFAAHWHLVLEVFYCNSSRVEASIDFLCMCRLVVMATCSTWSICCSMEQTWAPRMPREMLLYTSVPYTTRWAVGDYICWQFMSWSSIIVNVDLILISYSNPFSGYFFWHFNIFATLSVLFIRAGTQCRKNIFAPFLIFNISQR